MELSASVEIVSLQMSSYLIRDLICMELQLLPHTVNKVCGYAFLVWLKRLCHHVLTLMFFKTCMTFVWKTKEDIWRNVSYKGSQRGPTLCGYKCSSKHFLLCSAENEVWHVYEGEEMI